MGSQAPQSSECKTAWLAIGPLIETGTTVYRFPTSIRERLRPVVEEAVDGAGDVRVAELLLLKRSAVFPDPLGVQGGAAGLRMFKGPTWRTATPNGPNPKPRASATCPYSFFSSLDHP